MVLFMDFGRKDGCFIRRNCETRYLIGCVRVGLWMERKWYSPSLFNLGAIPAYAYLNGEKLQIVFPMDKLLNVVTTLGSSVESLSIVTELLKNYDSVKVGFEFSK